MRLYEFAHAEMTLREEEGTLLSRNLYFITQWPRNVENSYYILRVHCAEGLSSIIVYIID